MLILLGILFCVASVVTGQTQQCSNQVQICSPISNFPDGIPQNPISIEKSIMELKAELASLSKQVNVLSSLGSDDRPSESGSCPRIKYDFPRQRQTSDYARYRRYVPRLDAGTACMWINATDVSHDLSFFSYAVRNAYNSFLLFYRPSAHVLALHIGTTAVDLPLTLVPNTMTHLCGWFDASSREVGLYVNGEATQRSSYSGVAMPGGGSLLLAQDQDSLGGRFSSAQSFTGVIESPVMWPRVLTAKEVGLIAIKCICPSDYVVSMTRDTMELYGQASYSVPDQCQSLK